MAWLVFLVVFDHASSVHAQDAVCAQVKIEIKQKISLERQAFDAVMRIDNGLDTSSIQNVGINLTFQDQAGNAVIASSDPNNTNASFFVSVSSLAGIGAIDGTGSVGPKTTGEIHWLILPAAGTGGTQQGKMYFVGATLTYSLAGTQSTVAVTPDFITVKPQPLLALDYFLAGDVYADDAFTPQVEPPVPFTLGVRIKNVGGGTAAKTVIESAQPQIVDNQQGLAIAFQIVNGYVNDQPAGKTLQLDFGDIASGTSKVGRWDMVTSLSGRFTDFQAGFTHADSLGGALTSLIQGVSTHQLVHDVVVDLPGRDSVRDFLALDTNVLRVYESEGTDSPAIDQSANAQLQPGSAGQYNLTFPSTTGFAYVRLTDPYAGQTQPGAVMRSDRKALPATNVWLSKKRNADLTWSYFVNFFDVNTTGSYSVALSGVTAYATLAGSVYSDANANGQRDTGESGIGASAVTLTGTDAQGANVNTTGYTDSTGAFSFVQLNPGTYTLQVAALQGFADGPETVGSSGGTAGTASIASIPLSAGANATGYAFAKRSTSGSVADVGVGMTASTPSARVGDTVVFHLTATNAGPSTATAMVVTDTLPAGLSLVTASASAGTYDAATGAWAPGNLATGSVATLDLTARIGTIGALTNAATVASSITDPNAANNIASATVTGVAGTSNLTSGIVAESYRVPGNGAVEVLVTLNNFGPDPANTAVVSVTPSNLAIVSGAPSNGTFDSATGTWTVPTLPVGASATLVLRAGSVGSPSGMAAVATQVNGTALSAARTDYVKFNPVDCGCADLGLHIGASAPSASVGAAIDWIVTATNHGPNPAVATVATIPLPASVALVSVSSSRGAYDAASGQWSIGTLHLGDSATLTLHTTVTASISTIVSGSIDAGDGPALAYDDLTSVDNVAFTNANGGPLTAGMHLTQSVDKLTPAVGEIVTLTVTVGNEGPSNASGVTVVDVLPSGLNFVSAIPTQGNFDASSGVWAVGAIAPQAGATLTLRATPTTASSVSTAALVFADQIDGSSLDNVARVTLNQAQADASVAIAVDASNPSVGQTATFTVTAGNLGPAAVGGLVVSVPIPSGLTLAGTNAAQGSYDPVKGLWKIGNLAANASSTLTLSAGVNLHTPISVAARVHESATRDGNTANNEAVLTLNSVSLAVLSAMAASSNATYDTSESAMVNVAVTNIGTADAHNIIINTVVRDITNAQVHASSQSVATLAEGASTSLTFAFALGSDAAGSYIVTVQGVDDAGDVLPAVTTSYAVIAAPVASNVALASAGSQAFASSTYSGGYPPSAVIDNARSGANAGNGGFWNDATANAWPDWVQINFNGPKTIERVVVYSVQDNYQSPAEPTDTLAFSAYGVTDFIIQGWNDATGWVTLATVSGNHLVKRSVTFAAYTTDRIRVQVTGALDTWSRIVEIEAWGIEAPGTPSTALLSSANPVPVGAAVTLTATVRGLNPTGNVTFTDGGASIGGCASVALSGSGNSRTAACNAAGLSVGTHSIVAAYGGDLGNPASTSAALSINVVATADTNVALGSAGSLAFASSTYSAGYPASAVIDNERAGTNAGNGGYWNDATANVWPDWVQINFNGTKTVERVVVYSVQDNVQSPVEPTNTLTFSAYGVTDFIVQGWNDATGWVTLAAVSGNHLVKRSVTFAAYTTDRIRVQVTGALDTWSRIAEVEAWGIDAATSVNVASASNGAVVTASSVHGPGYPVEAVNDGERWH